MKQYTVAVLGATGAVGQEMIKILQAEAPGQCQKRRKDPEIPGGGRDHRGGPGRGL